jgi:hypothetical protein
MDVMKFGRLIDVRDEQPTKALFPMDVKVSGTSIDFLSGEIYCSTCFFSKTLAVGVFIILQTSGMGGLLTGFYSKLAFLSGNLYVRATAIIDNTSS